MLGGVLGTVASGTLEYDLRRDLRRDLGVLPMIGVGIVEEAAKLLVPLAA
jgi:hypothetical protein